MCDPVELIEANGNYAVIHHSDGQESTVSTSDLAPYPRPHDVRTQRPSEATVLENSKGSQALDADSPDVCDSGATPRYKKCLTTARQRRTVIRLYPCCDVQHDSGDPPTVTGNGRFNREHFTLLLIFICWGDCEEFALLERRFAIYGPALISAD